MHSYLWYMWGLKVIWLVFVTAFGACIGSLTNVIAYRMPRGINIVYPPSRCPKCNTRLTWRENIPVFGWLLLRGKCRFCKAPISPEYPIVEAAVAILFGVFFALYYMVPDQAVLFGVNWGAIKPEWVLNDASVTWPTFVVLVMLLGSLGAMLLVDAKTYTIPLPLAWFPAVLGIVVHPIHAAVVGRLVRTAPGWDWSIATPGPNGWPWIGGSLGASVGLVFSNILLSSGLLKRSFGDYEAWEKAELAKRAPAERPTSDPQAGAPAGGPSADANPATGIHPGAPPTPLAAPDDPAQLWIEYPHARREMLREVLFLALPFALGVLGWVVAERLAGPWHFNPLTGTYVATVQAPPWLSVLSGALMGYLIGGGVVWAVRILGSLAFGKEAMGLGDVHLMAGVGACLGWIDPVLAFFGAAFVGLFFAILGRVFSGMFKRAMPYGPYLAIATVLVLVAKPSIEQGLTVITKSPVPVNIP